MGLTEEARVLQGWDSLTEARVLQGWGSLTEAREAPWVLKDLQLARSVAVMLPVTLVCENV